MLDSHCSLGSVRRGRLCFCGERAIILTSITDENPGETILETVNDCDFFDWVEQDGKDIVIGSLRMKITTLKGTVRRLQRVNKVLLVSTVFLVVALATIMFFICLITAAFFLAVVLYFIGDLTGVGWDEATAGWVGGGADDVPAGWVEAAIGCEGAGCGVDEAPAGWAGDGSGADDVLVGHFCQLWPSCPQRLHLFLFTIPCEDEAEAAGSVADDLGHFRRLWPFFPQSLHFCVWPVLLTSSAHRNVVLSGIDSCSNALEEFGSSVYKLLHPQPSFLALFSPILPDGEHKTSAQHWEAAHLLQILNNSKLPSLFACCLYCSYGPRAFFVVIWTSNANCSDPFLVILYKLDSPSIKYSKTFHCINKLLLGAKDGAKLKFVIFKILGLSPSWEFSLNNDFFLRIIRPFTFTTKLFRIILFVT
ncbi:hypothetical protein G2W53_010246 [Senna tora]|uniref:Uncharacterized protein n=1 Tax=Senna tora TaxID=362788 RepID=A0A834WZ99_9FABA|nr:hypothetical protein G2W53_010246 [Senna tora]